jgi:hypothetical protein
MVRMRQLHHQSIIVEDIYKTQRVDTLQLATSRRTVLAAGCRPTAIDLERNEER